MFNLIIIMYFCIRLFKTTSHIYSVKKNKNSVKDVEINSTKPTLHLMH